MNKQAPVVARRTLERRATWRLWFCVLPAALLAGAGSACGGRIGTTGDAGTDGTIPGPDAAVCPVSPGCPVDCGNGMCGADENCDNCAADCGQCTSSCGDTVCDPTDHCSTCPSDCGTCSGSTAVVTRGPYLQVGTPTSVVIKWRTDQPTDSWVEAGVSAENLNRVASSSSSTTEHEVTLTGLSPNVTYYYAFGSSEAELSGGDGGHSFTTSPAVGTPLSTRIWIIGDSGTGNDKARAVRDAFSVYTQSRRPNLWLMLGDNAYENGTDSEYQSAVFDTYPDQLRTAVVWPTLGNHDGKSADSSTQSGPYYDIFTLPKNGEAGGVPSGTEAYYSFDYANIHFICLDSHDTDTAPDGAMLGWLENDLAANNSDWLIAFWHHPPYSKGSHDSDSEGSLIDMRENALPILEQYGVDLVFAGHSHSYERSMLLNGHYGDSDSLNSSMIIDSGDGDESGDGAYDKSSSSDGAVYVVAGSSGKISSAPLDHPAMIVNWVELGSVIVDVDDSRLETIFLNDDGTIRDDFVVLKTNGGL